MEPDLLIIENLIFHRLGIIKIIIIIIIRYIYKIIIIKISLDYNEKVEKLLN